MIRNYPFEYNKQKSRKLSVDESNIDELTETLPYSINLDDILYYLPNVKVIIETTDLTSYPNTSGDSGDSGDPMFSSEDLNIIYLCFLEWQRLSKYNKIHYIHRRKSKRGMNDTSPDILGNYRENHKGYTFFDFMYVGGIEYVFTPVQNVAFVKLGYVPIFSLPYYESTRNGEISGEGREERREDYTDILLSLFDRYLDTSPSSSFILDERV